jgi:chorismate mutase/prephenate dehydratase
MENTEKVKDIKELRREIDEIDGQLVELFIRRMEVSGEVARYKKATGAPILDPARERERLSEVSTLAGEEYEAYTRVLYALIMELSKNLQQKEIYRSSRLRDTVRESVLSTTPLFPEKATVACQGVEGAYSGKACERLFTLPTISYFKDFEGVFKAIEEGKCRYGVLPIENSTAGSVNAVYDLMSRYNFRIVRSLRMKVDHCLLAQKGATLSDIKEICSHEQAINQCAGFLRSLGEVKITVCPNTAVAARTVAQSGRKDLAALSSSSCAALYGLSMIASSVQDQGNNHTRFICISAKEEIYPGADRTSVMMVISHRPGALYRVLSRFYALGINLVKLESRPIPDRDFEFMFYFDLQVSIYSEKFDELLNELEHMSDEVRYLGSYQEVF